MNPVSPITPENLAQRRRKLKRQRGWKVVRTVWRTFLVSAMAGGVFWAIAQPIWLIRNPKQIQVEGNTLLSEEAIRSLLPLEYPISLFHVRPQLLQEALETSAPIRAATVSRELIPPHLVIQVQERRPVAQATAPAPAGAKPGANGQPPAEQIQGLLDDRGFLISAADLVRLESTAEFPPLKVMGMREEYRSLWPELYAALQASPIKVESIDWRDPNNLVLKTDLGIVYCGPFSSQFKAQLAVLDRMRDVAQHPEAKQVAYIDLSRPDAPYLQMTKPKEKAGLP